MAAAMRRAARMLLASTLRSSSSSVSAASTASCRDRYVFLSSRRSFCSDELEHDARGSSGRMSVPEAKRLLRQVNVQTLKKQLQAREFPCMDYTDLSTMCREAGLADTPDAARRLVSALDEAGDIILFRNKVYLDPQQIAELVANALPLHLISEDDPRVKEFEDLQEKIRAIELIAYRQVRRFMWFGLLALTTGTGLLVRLTFWELSWDVMEPIAFFLTSSFLIAGYAYFLFSRRDPTYQGLMHSLLASRRRRLMKRMRFDYERYKALEKQCINTCKHAFRKQRREYHHDDDRED